MASSSSRPLLLVLLLLLILALSSLLIATASPANDAGHPDFSDDEEIGFLEEEEEEETVDDDSFRTYRGHADEDESEMFDDENAGPEIFDESFDGEAPAEDEPIDESDVVVLTDRNFTGFLAEHRHVMVEFYAPWCGHCQALAPEYAAASTALKGEDAVLAKVDAAEENELAQKFEIQGFPTLLFFVDGVHKDYSGQRTREAIVTWIKKKLGPGVTNITTVEEAEKILADESKVVFGYFDSLVGADSQEFAAASKLEDGVNFIQTTSSEVAKLFHLEPNAKHPSVVLMKKEAEKIAYFDGEFSKSAIADFVFANKLPLVTTFTREAAPELFDNVIKKQILLFAVSNDAEKVMPAFQESAKFFKGKLIFIYVESDNDDVGKSVSEYFGVSGDAPKVLAYSGNEDAKKYFFNGKVTVENIKGFAEDFFEDKLLPFYKSDPVPETNDSDVKIVVGNNFDEIVLDESKDVLLEIYAPWCGHCQAFEPTYNKLAKHLRGIESLVVANMDGTTNEHPRAKPDGYPTILFFPAGNKSFNPITVDADRTVVALYKFIKKHAVIPFKLQRPASAKQSESADDASFAEDEKSTSSDSKDEL